MADLGKDWQTRYPQSADVEMELMLAESLMELKRYEEALALYGKVGQNKKTPEQYRFPALLQELTCLSILERHQELLQKGQKLIEEFPNCPEDASFSKSKAAQVLKNNPRQKISAGGNEFLW